MSGSVSFVAAMGIVGGVKCILNIERGPKYAGTPMEGRRLPGCCMEPRERPEQGAVRALGEILKPDGSSVITEIDPGKVRLTVSWWNSINVWYGNLQFVTSCNEQDGHTYQLSDAQVDQVLAHIRAMAEDEAYAAAVRNASDQEVWQLHMTPIAEMGSIKFAHSHEKTFTSIVAM